MEGISLVEWPSRLGSRLPQDRLEITFRIDLELNHRSDESARDGDDNDGDNENDDSIARLLILQPIGDRWIEKLKRVEADGYLDDMIIVDDDDDDGDNDQDLD